MGYVWTWEVCCLLENHEWSPSYFSKYSIELIHWELLNHILVNIFFYKFWQGEKVKLFYNPAATQLAPSEEFGIAFNGNFLCDAAWLTKIYHFPLHL